VIFIRSHVEPYEPPVHATSEILTLSPRRLTCLAVGRLTVPTYYNIRHGMGKRARHRQAVMSVPLSELPIASVLNQFFLNEALLDLRPWLPFTD
jgi:hypothetical protein